MNYEALLYALQAGVVALWAYVSLSKYLRRRRARWMIGGREVRTVDDSGEAG